MRQPACSGLPRVRAHMHGTKRVSGVEGLLALHVAVLALRCLLHVAGNTLSSSAWSWYSVFMPAFGFRGSRSTILPACPPALRQGRSGHRQRRPPVHPDKEGEEIFFFFV